VISARSGVFADVERRAIATFLASLPPVASNQYLSLLSALFRRAVARGLRADTVRRERSSAMQRCNASACRERYSTPSMIGLNPMDVAGDGSGAVVVAHRENLVLLQGPAWEGGKLSARQKKG